MKRGQMLLEVVLALAIVTIVMVALVQLSTRSIKNSDFSRYQAEATSYASQAMEWIRADRNTKGWEEWWNNHPCGPVCDVIIGNRYTVHAGFTPTPGSPQRIAILVTVTWAQGGKSFSAKQDAIFTQY
ncbi:MAG: hypothetical protein UX52_C0007G0004 [Candidatus Amesbacteria bacterium GW2011_GWA1_46_35]|uniref:Uncharacterized protein n=1 Tax=Candidatus Amesbacteria bacterium GW2011_GWC2_45_19 TaxID=1618366 RepID=A0A0G1Q2R4_9BACT|nr:MAG: hypothetical protein UX05_C0005G0042 [Candidatus Amesbacteria bacterium GW2011_GWC2_45_19]KKU38351.1 MAG: hypothetical protein UX52_C0007G0004 [Candidatus Amesbacteria bacterium GW2011_GWA1_46_35]KKU68806.1 MAG: hypothetical protein UX93_C0005G0042 [Microgenomates group bacterium GW2011_GWC1_47_20]